MMKNKVLHLFLAISIALCCIALALFPFWGMGATPQRFLNTSTPYITVQEDSAKTGISLFADNRGPGIKGDYTPDYSKPSTEESSQNTYADRFVGVDGVDLFNYTISKVEIALYVVFAVTIAGAITFTVLLLVNKSKKG